MSENERITELRDMARKLVNKSIELVDKAERLIELADSLEEEVPEVELPYEIHAVGFLSAESGSRLTEGLHAGEWYFGTDTVEASGIEPFSKSLVTEWIPGKVVTLDGGDPG